MNNDILFERVCCYNAEGEQVLKDLSFHIPENSLLALAGDQGCCRAVMELIAGKRTIHSGCIRLGGHELFKLPAKQVYCLHDEPMLPATTIYQHIATARANATKMEVLEAAAAAMVVDFTWELRDGVNSRCAELTDVQRHCIAIAKAILQPAPVVAIHAADNEEACVWEAMRALAKDKTVIITGGGPVLFEYADAVLILKDGGIAVYENRLSAAPE